MVQCWLRLEFCREGLSSHISERSDGIESQHESKRKKLKVKVYKTYWDFKIAEFPPRCCGWYYELESEFSIMKMAKAVQRLTPVLKNLQGERKLWDGEGAWFLI